MLLWVQSSQVKYTIAIAVAIQKQHLLLLHVQLPQRQNEIRSLSWIWRRKMLEAICKNDCLYLVNATHFLEPRV